jgi:hypothetical protein
MNRWFHAAVVAFSLGTTMPGVAQPMTREALFADYLQQNIALALNSVSGFKANVLGTKPELKSAPDDPVRGRPFGDAFAQMQADSSNGGEFTRAVPVFTAEGADPVRNESFADTFTRMQAASSSSGQFKLPAERGRTRFASATGSR